MNETIKMSVVFGSLMFAIIIGILGIISFVEFQRIQEKCIYLEKQIEQQTMLIDYLKGDNEIDMGGQGDHFKRGGINE